MGLLGRPKETICAKPQAGVGTWGTLVSSWPSGAGGYGGDCSPSFPVRLQLSRALMQPCPSILWLGQRALPCPGKGLLPCGQPGRVQGEGTSQTVGAHGGEVLFL